MHRPARVEQEQAQVHPGPAEATATTFTNSITGASVTLRPTTKFRERFTNTPREKARENGRAVLKLKDDELFEVVPTPDAGR